MITEVKEVGENKEEKAIEKCIKNFNKASKSLNSIYIMKIGYNQPHIYRKLWIFPCEIAQVYYSEASDEFSFIEGITRDVFEELKPILEKVEEKWKVELKW